MEVTVLACRWGLKYRYAPKSPAAMCRMTCSRASGLIGLGLWLLPTLSFTPDRVCALTLRTYVTWALMAEHPASEQSTVSYTIIRSSSSNNRSAAVRLDVFRRYSAEMRYGRAFGCGLDLSTASIARRR